MRLQKSPGPQDYQTLEIKTTTERPLTGQKCHSIAEQQFTKDPKDTMKVNIYAPQYERDYANRIGPGPAAYSSLSTAVKTDRFKFKAFPQTKRLLTQGKKGPGPSDYDTDTKCLETCQLKFNPRAAFPKAKRTIDVVNF